MPRPPVAVSLPYDAVPGVQVVVVVVAEQPVITGATGDGVAAVATFEAVIAETAVDRVVVVATQPGVVTRATAQGVATVAALQAVVAGTADEGVVTVAAEQRVGAAESQITSLPSVPPRVSLPAVPVIVHPAGITSVTVIVTVASSEAPDGSVAR